MAKILEFMDHRDAWIEERYELIRERMDSLAAEDKSELFCSEYLEGMARFLHDALRVYDLKAAQMLETLPLEQQKGIHDQLYGNDIWKKYGSLSDACWNLTEEWGPLLWSAGREWYLAASYACGGQKFLLTIAVELFLQVYQLFEMERIGELHREELWESVRQAIYYHFSDYCDVISALVYHERFFPGEFHRQLLEAAHEEQYGIYRLGGPVTDRAKEQLRVYSGKTHEAAEKKEQLIRHVVTALKGAAGEKRRIAMYVPVGAEALAVELYHGLTEIGCGVVCLRRQETFTARIGEMFPANQFAELPLFWDKGLKERRLAEEKNALDAYRTYCQELWTILDLEGMGMDAPGETCAAEPEAFDRGADMAVSGNVDGSQICLSLTPKQERYFAEYQEAMRALRCTV